MNGSRFRDIRRLAGLTQVRAANLLGCSERTIADAENGRRDVKPAYAIGIAALHYHACRRARIAAEDAEAHAATVLRETIEGGKAS